MIINNIFPFDTVDLVFMNMILVMALKVIWRQKRSSICFSAEDFLAKLFMLEEVEAIQLDVSAQAPTVIELIIRTKVQKAERYVFKLI